MSIERREKQKGFTLLEVLTVIGIIGILSVLAIPATRMVEKAVMEAGAIKGLRVIQGAFEMYYREMGMYPVHTTEPSRLFFREIDRFLPDVYYIRHAENQFIRGYRLLAYGYIPNSAVGEEQGGGGGFGGGGSDTPTRYGNQNYVLMAVPIQNNLGLSTFFLDPSGVITKDDLLAPY
jgi:prepilin-type N-terminal cleavage/methylation domain-containing protein